MRKRNPNVRKKNVNTKKTLDLRRILYDYVIDL